METSGFDRCTIGPMAYDYTSQSDSPPLGPKMISVPVSNFRANFSKMLDELGDVYEEITLTKNGEITAHILLRLR